MKNFYILLNDLFLDNMFADIKNKLMEDKEIVILFIILLFFNICFYFNLFGYMVSVNKINPSAVHDVFTILSAIIIFGFISSRLAKHDVREHGSVYEIGYLIITGLLSLTISYFNRSSQGESLWAPFIEMFKMLSVVLIITYVATKSKSFKSLVKGDRSLKTIIGQVIICSILGVLASYFTMDVNGVPANSRGLIVMISALLGGPYVGIPVGLISGICRYNMGGPTALACCVATILAGIIGSLINRWNNGEFLKPYKAALLMFLFCGFEMWIVCVLTPWPEGLFIANAVYAPMTFAAVLGMLLFTMFLGEKKEEITGEELKKAVDANADKISVNSDIIDINTDRIIEISRELKEYKNRAEESEKELKDYKDKVDVLEQQLDDIKNKL